MHFPAFSDRLARVRAALRAAPEEIPVRNPSFLASILPALYASPLSTRIISS